jgi:hypothetical protein
MATFKTKTMNEIPPCITIAPQKIRTSLATQDKMKHTRPEPLNFPTVCGCYKRGSIDARCCGVCYVCCPRKTVEEQCNFCPNNFTTYWDSGYVQTISGHGKQAELDEKNGLCCWFCFPLKFSLFFPCCFGAIGNSCINEICGTNVNYFF